MQRERRQKIGLLVIGILVLWGILSTATYWGWIHGTDHRDFYPWWAGSRFTVLEGKDLYDRETTRLMQIELYGKELPPERDQQAFVYPATLVPLLLPFWLIPDVEIATALWEGLSIILLVFSLLLLRHMQNDSPRLWITLIMPLWFYAILMIFQAQITAMLMAALSVSYWAYVTRHDTLMGLALIPATVKPELMALPVVLLLGSALIDRRWRVVIVFITGLIVLLLASFLAAGFWFIRWLDAIEYYAKYAQSSWAIETAWETHSLIGLLLIVTLLAMVMRTRWTVPTGLGVAICLGQLLLPQTLIWGLTVLLIPLMLAWPRAPRAVVVIWITGWLLAFGLGIDDWWRYQNLILPVLTLGVIMATSRTSTDDVRDRRLRAVQPGIS